MILRQVKAQDRAREDASESVAVEKQKDEEAEALSHAGLSARRLYFGVFLTSAAVLLLEISLTRIFSYTIWYHFTYVTISLAMLGFGASGAVLAASEKLGRQGMKLAHHASLIAAASVPLMLVVISQVPFYPFQLFSDPLQVVYMVLYYVAVTLPFFCAGMTISCTFKSMPLAASRIYFWDLVGAGSGCLVIVTAIKLLGVPAVAALSVTLFLLAAVMFLTNSSNLRTVSIVAVALLWIFAGSNVEKVLQFHASKEKIISQIENKEMTFSKWSPIFRVDAFNISGSRSRSTDSSGAMYGIEDRNLPADFANAFVAHDGDACAMMIKSDRNLSGYEAFEGSILRLPYLHMEQPKVLIIGPGGGVDVGVALKNKSRSVLAVELDPLTTDLVSHKYADFVGHLYDNPRVQVNIDEGRSFLRRTEEKFDLIQMTGVDTLAALNSGAYVLAENYLYTVEAYTDFMNHLNPDGILCMTFMDAHFTMDFPRHTARHTSLSIAALKRRGIEESYRHIAIFSKIPFATVMTKMSPFTPSEVQQLAKFAEQWSFNMWYLPGRKPDNPIGSLVACTDDQRERIYKNFPLQIQATTDDAPFFFHFYKWGTLLKKPDIDTRHSLATGQLILLLVLVLSIMFSIALIIFPLYRFQKAGLHTSRKWNYILYFAALGLGFIFLEISYIQRFILFLGYPTYSLTVILFSLLTFSGIGSYLSGKLPFSSQRIISVAVILLALVALGYMAVLPPIFNHFLGSPKELRIAISLLLLLPLGLLLGMFFPTGIKIISGEDRRFIPWAWGVNGCASVIGTVLSIIIAMSYGFSSVTVLAVVIYMVGVTAILVGRRDTVGIAQAIDR